MKRVMCVGAVLVSVAILAGILVTLQPSNAASQDKPIQLTVASWSPPKQILNRGVIDPWIKEVEKRTNGKVKITNFPGSALGKPPEHYDLAVKGLADIASCAPAYMPGRFPLSSVIELPFLAPNPTDTSHAYWQIYKKFPAIQAEYNDVKVLALFTNDPMQIHTRNKAIRSLEDLKGMKIRVGDKLSAEALKAVGGSPIFMPITEVYLALEKGVIDGAGYTLEAVRAFKLQEVSRYCTVLNLNCLRMGLVMNLNKWKSLPQDIQRILEEELGGDYLVDLNAKGYEGDLRAGLKTLKDSGNEIIYLSADERAKWAKRLMPIREAWLEEMKAKNLPGKEVLDSVLWLEGKYGK